MQPPGEKRYPSLGFSKLPHMSKLHKMPLKTSILLGDVMGILGDILGLPRPTILWRGLNPPKYRSAQLPLVDSSILLW
jgi:hypothetical protein